jgi:hypothetical protein
VKNSILSVKSENESIEAGESWFWLVHNFAWFPKMQSSGIWHLEFFILVCLKYSEGGIVVLRTLLSIN